MKKPVLITSALPYINGIKHLGNLIGSILPSDVYARYLRQQGSEVLFICGTDEHGTPAEIAAEEADMSIEDFCDQMHQTQRDIYESFDIKFDHFGRSSSSENTSVTQEIFTRLDDAGFIEERELEQFFSPHDERFLPDRYVTGTCPKCNFNKARGDQCDGCGSLLEANELLNPRSTISGHTDLELKKSKHLFLRLDKLTDKLSPWLASKNWSSTARGIAEKWMAEGLEPRCITRDLTWGVKVNKTGYEDKVFYVWFDAPHAYIAITQSWAKLNGDEDAWRYWWQNEDVHYVQFMAKDNVPFHSVFWPAILLGAQADYHLVDELKGFNWLNYEDGKFSTSLKRGVFTDQALELYPADYWRFALLANTPDASDSSFSFSMFGQEINKGLADVLGNFVARVDALSNKYFDRTYTQDFEPDNALISKVTLQTKLIASRVDELKFHLAINELRNLWSIGNEYITNSAPWAVLKVDINEGARILKHCLWLWRLFGIVTSPFCPTIAKQVVSAFDIQDIESISWEAALKTDFLNNGFKHGKNLFYIQKVTIEEIGELEKKFSGR